MHHVHHKKDFLGWKNETNKTMISLEPFMALRIFEMVIGNQCHVTEVVKAQKGNGFTFSTVSYVSLGLLCVYY